MINYKNYKNEGRGPQASWFKNFFKDILDQRRCLDQIDPECSPTINYFILFSKLVASGKSKNGGRRKTYRRVPSWRWRQLAEPQTKGEAGEVSEKNQTCSMEKENLETKRRTAKDGTGTVIIKDWNTGTKKWKFWKKQRKGQNKTTWEFDSWCT